MRWIYHLVRASEISLGDDARYVPPSLATEGFIHGSFHDAVAESARLYFRDVSDVRVMQIDPRALDVPVHVIVTPRGGMPHVHGPILRRAIIAVHPLEAVADLGDRFDP